MIYRFGECTLDTQRHRLQRAGQPVRLRSKAFQVLRYLLEHRDRTVLKQELCEQVWPQQFISDATLESTVSTVRQAIGDSGRAQQLIQTVYGYGYRFVATVEELADPPAEREANASGMRPDPVATHPLEASAVVPLPPTQGPAASPDSREGGGGKDQEGAPSGDLLQRGEWKLVTILCAAPVTRSAEGAQQDADTRYRQLSRLHTLAQPVVQRFAGTLQPVVGDHLLAVFGTPLAQEDHAQRAVLAALELQRQVREAGMDGRAQQDDALGVRVGLDTGQVAVGGIRDATAELAAVVGETVMRALTLQAQAAPGAILCSAATAHLVQEELRIEAVAPVPMVGEATPVAAYTVLGPQRQRPFRARAGRLWSPFVGRRRELETLRHLLTQVEGGRGQVVGMIGEPGVGKSRLCHEFLRNALGHPWAILETQATTYGQATPYLPLIDLLKGYFHIADRDDPTTIREKVTAKVCGLDDALIPTVPAFLTLLEVPVEDRGWQMLDVPQRRQCSLEALKRLLLRGLCLKKAFCPKRPQLA